MNCRLVFIPLVYNHQKAWICDLRGCKWPKGNGYFRLVLYLVPVVNLTHLGKKEPQRNVSIGLGTWA